MEGKLTGDLYSVNRKRTRMKRWRFWNDKFQKFVLAEVNKSFYPSRDDLHMRG